MLQDFNISESVCLTGHRMILPQEVQILQHTLRDTVEKCYHLGYRYFLCGGALGFDTLAENVLLQSRSEYPDIKLVIVIPCSSQADRWNPKDRKIYQDILKQADDVIILSDFYYAGCMQTRNRFMVDHSSMCICYMTQMKGGTWSTVRYALHQGLQIKNLAMTRPEETCILKENLWNYIYISRSVQGNASIVHLSPSPSRKTGSPNILKQCSWKRSSESGK